MNRRRIISMLFVALYALQLALLIYWHALASTAGIPSVFLTVLTAVLAGVIDAASARFLQHAINQTEKAHAAQAAEKLERSLQEYSDMAEHEARMVSNISRAIERELESARSELSRGEVDGACARMQTSLDMASEAYSLQHENIVIAAVLDAQKRQCEGKGIELKTSVALPSEVGLPDIELATMVFSLIDYAQDRCEESGETAGETPVIHVRMLTDLGQLVVEVEGPAPKERLARRRRGEQALHSDGNLAIVKEMTERYNGIMEIDDGGKTCRVSVMLPVVSGGAASE